eukprot:SAG31_NODE_531_length_14413_cov_7.712659_19_plen_99_part_00
MCCVVYGRFSGVSIPSSWGAKMMVRCGPPPSKSEVNRLLLKNEGIDKLQCQNQVDKSLLDSLPPWMLSYEVVTTQTLDASSTLETLVSRMRFPPNLIL